MRHLFFTLACRLLFCSMALSMSAADTTAVTSILGSDPAAWSITGPLQVTGTGKAVALTTEGTLTLEEKTQLEAPVEYRVTFRLRPKPGSHGSISVSVGSAEKQVFTTTASATPESGYLSYTASGQPGQAKPLAGYLYLQAVSERSLAWSDEMRRTIEAQIGATPKLQDMPLTLRLVLTDRGYSSWLNGRYIGQLPVGDGFIRRGAVRIILSANTELLSVRALPGEPAQDRFVPVELDGFVNAAALVNGQALAAVPAVKQGMLDSVRFRFPTKTATGHDHLDLAPSWTRFGALSGYFEANSGTFGGRWVSADRVDPSRFCWYIPYGQYKALHLIAAFDGETNNVPVITAQFYRPNAGHPMNFTGTVPAFGKKAGGAKAFPVKLTNGKTGNLYHVIIPLDPDKMAWFSDLPRVGLELTKAVQPYRGYPDPLVYSWHAAGLPSGVHVYAATLEKAGVDVDPQPDALGHVWTAPAQPGYTVTLRNNTGKATTAKLTFTTVGYDGVTAAREERTVALPATDAAVPVKITPRPKKYGLNYLKITCAQGGETTVHQRNFAYLHPDTRERGDWEEGRGPIIGFWSLGGGHDTPDAITEFTVMAQLGAETSLNNFKSATPELKALATKLKFTSRQAFDMGVIYTNSFAFDDSRYDRKNPEAAKKYLLQEFTKMKVDAGPLNKPEYMPFFPEPQLGRLSSAIFPRHYNGSDYVYTKEEQAYFKDRLDVFLLGARIVRERWPEVKILLPYGDPMYTAQFLESCPEAREFIDGSALDLPLFERLPEQQINQVVLNRLYPIFQDIRKYKPNPYFVMTEGPAVSSIDVDTTEEEHANLCTRNMLALFGYGVYNHESANEPYDCGNYWGENHYGGGLCTRVPKAMPKIAYVSSATMTRHLNRSNFVKYVPTGSTSVYCQQYKHYRTGKLVYVLWTIRGTRPVSVKAPQQATLALYDVNDNPTPLPVTDGRVSFTIGQTPVYLEGMTGEVEMTLGEPNHADAVPSATAVRLANPGDGSWALSTRRDEEYENTNKLQIERFPGNMSVQPLRTPKAQGGTALAVHLGKQEIDRKVMPYYTTIVPAKLLTIPGKGSHLGLWVQAASDWGRVVYSLRDANGERWLSVGTKEDWNSDDIRCWSAFCFDGWRYLRFQLPANAPYDSYRERGSTNWGSYGGDGIVDLPLALEKIIIERHASVIYGNDLVPAKTDDVLLGDLCVEYAVPADRGAEAVRLSKLRMPIPAGAPELGNPIAEMAKSGIAAPTSVLKVTDPTYRYDGTRCHVHFTPVDGAKGYNVWVSPYPDGRGAMQLGSNWQASGGLIEGLHAETDFYLFVVYTDRDGKLSKPSVPLRIRLKNRFVYQ